ncbi:MAG: zinc/manganese transporter permease [Gammaproteobacteria bacterium RBG_16_51_14]|nr:MAG: zinc/manganese transporter permease [Gammaproteobacteria bacterium RBG_16_51_14]
MNPGTIELGIIIPAFLAGLLVLSTHVPLGQEVLARGIIFIDLAIAQIAGLGVISAYSFGWQAQGCEVQLAAGGAALSGSVLLHYTEKNWPEIQEAIIGVIFVLAASGGLLLLSNNPHGGEHLRDLLVGQILWVNYSTLLPVAFLYALILFLWFGMRDSLRRLSFYLIFALAVTASVQLVGIYLVFASLIIPALATRNFSGPGRLAIGYGIGATAYAMALLISSCWDLPTGAVIVWSLAVLGLLFRSGLKMLPGNSRR